MTTSDLLGSRKSVLDVPKLGLWISEFLDFLEFIVEQKCKMLLESWMISVHNKNILYLS